MIPKTLSIVIPAYNEAATIGAVLKRIEAVELIDEIKKEIIVVDDCSVDETASIVKSHKSGSHTSVRYLRNQPIQGKDSPSVRESNKPQATLL
jgi:glycosyltransferase involved in cell wall biosynthesis